MTAAAGMTLDRKEVRRAVAASIIGNGLEWFDFISYGFFAAQISKAFFPTGNSTTALLLTFATFAVGFFVRPFGGVVIGLYADRVGRRQALALLIILMAAGTLLVGITPSYATIGLAAPLVIILARLIQGLSVGGEFASATAMLVEYAPPDRKMFYGSFQLCSQMLAMLLAAGFAFALTVGLSRTALDAWGWRIPFVLGALVGPVGFYIRRRVVESPEFQEFKRAGSGLDRAPRVSFLEYLRRHKGVFLCAFGLVVVGTANQYVWMGYMPVYVVRTLHLPLATILFGTSLCGLINLFTYPLMGIVADRVGPFRLVIPYMILSALLTYPAFAYIAAAPSFARLLEVQVGMTLLGALLGGPFAGLVTVLFPVGVRSTGAALAYNIAVALFGGLAPFTLTWLSTFGQGAMMPAYYTIACTILALILVVAPLGSPVRTRRAAATAVS